MTRVTLKHLTAVRWFHWINFPVLFLMIWSGILIYWANDVYHIGGFHFFPDWVYRLFTSITGWRTGWRCIFCLCGSLR